MQQVKLAMRKFLKIFIKRKQLSRETTRYCMELINNNKLEK